MVQARWYQEEALHATLFAWEEYQRVLLHSGTGSGKNFMASQIIAALQPKRCLFVGDQTELVNQPLDALDRFAGIVAGIDQASKKASLNTKVIVGSAQTISRRSRLERYPSDFFDYIINDEAHRFVDQKQRVFEYFSKAKVVGLTATPFRSALRDLSKWYEHVAYSMPMINLIEHGFAPPIKVLRLPVEIDLDAVKTNHGDYESESLSTTIAPYYARIAELLVEHAAGRKTIAFLPLISSSEAFAGIIRRTGLRAIHVDGNSSDRVEILEGFKRGDFEVLCNSDLVGTGVDLPIADCFVNLSPTHSAVRYQQRVGRILRVLPGVVDDLPGKDDAEERRERIASSKKPDALIIDFLWQHERLNVMRPEHLVAVNEDEAKAMFEKVKKKLTPEDLLALAKEVQAERESKLAERLEEVSARIPANALEPDALGYLFGSKDLMDYEPLTLGEAEPPSDKQLAALARWHVDTSKVRYRGQASKLMAVMMHRFRFKLATAKQLQALNRMKIKYSPWKLTLKQASALIAARLSRASFTGVAESMPF